ncbi:MAG TPA: 16S rRNA (adenine(1518)-N(6)/adenine(1519)-N(6))-dimethyltransferase RsmA [bacterium]|nr:16S rRNA (adenine(1518)-N(6)/adenine(1519)-N(6))-dimethyltransferase RsmA [bacterium]
MAFLTQTRIKELLAAADLQPDKRLGQNFLIDQHIFDKIIQAAELRTQDTVLEVGAGLGNLTGFLADNAEQVIAIEKDKRLIPLLKETMKQYHNIGIINQDILKLTLPLIKGNKAQKGGFLFKAHHYKLIANIPYYITSHLIRMFLETEYPPELVVLLIQKDVADRMLAEPPDMNLLALSVRYFAHVEIVTKVAKSCFWPAPEVESAIIKIVPDKEIYDQDFAQHAYFFQLVRAGFSQKRKKLATLLANELEISKQDIEATLARLNLPPTVRAQEVSLEQWQKISTLLK